MLRTVLRTRRRGERETASVHLHARLTEVGTLELWCGEIDGDRRWRLQFDVRSATQTDMAAHESAAESQGFLDEAVWDACRDLLHETFGPEGTAKPRSLKYEPIEFVKREMTDENGAFYSALDAETDSEEGR